MRSAASTYERIYAAVARIPAGRVATYGQIARLAGLAGHARQVGYALSSLRDGRKLPWHRVLNAKGEISARSEPGFQSVQRRLLEREGVIFGVNGRVPLLRFGWTPRSGPAPERISARRDAGAAGRRR